LILPSYSGSTLRGGFGHAFRRIICAFKGRECTDCLLRQQCVYAYVFETPIPADAQIMRKYTAAPHPFILEPFTNSRQNCQKGEDLSFGLTLIGRAADYLPYFIYAFEELGRIGIGKGRGKYELREVAEEGSTGDSIPKKRVIYSGDTKLLTQTNSPIQWTDIIANSQKPPHAVSISFITPTRIKYKNRLTKNLEFHVFFRNLLRRISLLSYFHCGHRIDDKGFKDLIEQARKIKTVKRSLYWHDWERYSNRQETRMKRGGFMGEIAYEGELKEFWSYIRLGEDVHIGKGSGFGLGRYRIENKGG
ncbi:MAG: CRISPR system precrRNA processing endoribonuclease RAMP protein Cas6, partial [Desulfobacterales bacterium]|nr:CRISPR system precrRNA processing endoribonuclease RAMP protein Cas6 [Desulfobacterales bacterium]